MILKAILVNINGDEVIAFDPVYLASCVTFGSIEDIESSLKRKGIINNNLFDGYPYRIAKFKEVYN